MRSRSKSLNITLWVVQSLLAALFLSGAAMKLFTAEDKLALTWPWTAGHHGVVLATAALDALAGLGLLLPAITGIRPRLTFYAALGAIVLMVSAIIFHFSRGEGAVTGINFIALFLAVFVAWGRRGIKDQSAVQAKRIIS